VRDKRRGRVMDSNVRRERKDRMVEVVGERV
jgi:hypothetical protein